MPTPPALRSQTPLQRSVVTNGIRDGHSQLLVVTFAAATTDKSIAHGLGRVPTGYSTIRVAPSGGIITDGTNQGTDWTVSTVVLQATVAGTYTIRLE